VATGIGPIAHGNDIGGSIRIPALFNGVVGLGVSLGRIPSYNPSQPVARPIRVQLMAVQGPLVRSVRDARLTLAAMAQGDPVDARWVDAPLAGPPLPCSIHVALVAQNPGGFTHPAQAEAVRQAGTSPPPAMSSTKSCCPIRFRRSATPLRSTSLTIGGASGR
jgi:amidase